MTARRIIQFSQCRPLYANDRTINGCCSAAVALAYTTRMRTQARWCRYSLHGNVFQCVAFMSSIPVWKVKLRPERKIPSYSALGDNHLKPHTGQNIRINLIGPLSKAIFFC